MDLPHSLTTSESADAQSLSSSSPVSSEQGYRHDILPSHPPPTARSRTSSHARSLSASSFGSSAASKKSRQAEPGTTEVNAERFVSAPHSSPASLRGIIGLATYNHRETPGILDARSEHSDLDNHSLVEEPEEATPRLRVEPKKDLLAFPVLPEPALSAKPSLSNVPARRSSSSSVFSLASVRGILSSSPTASEFNLPKPPRSVPSFMSSPGKATPAHSEAGVSNITVTTTSGQQGQNAREHNLTPRESPTQQSLDVMRRSQRADPGSRNQPGRSRSRAQRRFSGSTANSSHSPSSDRGYPYREKEECEYMHPADFFCLGNYILNAILHSKTCTMGRDWHMCLGYQGQE
jgi:inositol hexakisphosphate/diphosphoinositol-pentakisphosphate kinase